jgi:hypothetical protein
MSQTSAEYAIQSSAVRRLSKLVEESTRATVTVAAELERCIANGVCEAASCCVAPK